MACHPKLGIPLTAQSPPSSRCAWLEITRRKTPGKHCVAQCTAILERFVAFVQNRKPGIKEFVEVTPETANPTFATGAVFW
jgi:hypothetical protein